MTPSRPYFVRAIYEWLIDNQHTPFLLVDATRAGVQVPAAFVKEGRIVLNVAPGAVRDFFIHNDDVSFSARFGGVPMQVYVPMGAVLAVYSRENGQGMFFDEDDYPAGAAAPAAATPAPALAPVPVPGIAGRERGEGGDEPEPPRPGGGRPSLRVVK
ncbi:MAG TPA: ClpXP protease specificity-enhancing factor [Moraxellaceae bacterium]|nr:ClpXP protease specificity-enhancing factor [Moraxellaceae bacterium]